MHSKCYPGAATVRTSQYLIGSDDFFSDLTDLSYILYFPPNFLSESCRTYRGGNQKRSKMDMKGNVDGFSYFSLIISYFIF